MDQITDSGIQVRTTYVVMTRRWKTTLNLIVNYCSVFLVCLLVLVSMFIKMKVIELFGLFETPASAAKD